MRLKSYTAPSMAEAMHMIREELGEEAIIVSTQRAANGKGIRITAALEPGGEIEEDIGAMLAEAARTPTAEAVRQALADHGVPIRLADRLVNAVHASQSKNPVDACAEALAAGFVFAPLPERGAPRPFMLIGPPGSGKSVAVAKLAARSALRRYRVGVITCDNVRAGAVEQLRAFTSILEIELVAARGPEALKRAVESIQGRDIVFIDSPGLNPFKDSEMEFLAALAEAGDVEPILVLPAGTDPAEAAEIGEAFGRAGATRLFATRLDTTRRLGSIMAAADAAPLMLGDVSSTPRVVNGVTPINPAIMARMLLPQAAAQTDEPEPAMNTEAYQ